MDADLYIFTTSTYHTGPLRRFSTRVLQNAPINTIKRAMVCDVNFPFPKVLQLY